MEGIPCSPKARRPVQSTRRYTTAQESKCLHVARTRGRVSVHSAVPPRELVPARHKGRTAKGRTATQVWWEVAVSRHTAG